MKTFKSLTCLLLTLFLSMAAESQAQYIYLSGTVGNRSRVISNKGNTYNYNEPIITSLGANRDGVYALARTRDIDYHEKEQNDYYKAQARKRLITAFETYDQMDYRPRWNQLVTGGGVVYKNGSVYKSYTDPNWSREDFYSSLVLKVDGSNIIVAGVHTKPYQYDKSHKNLLGFQSMHIGEVNKLSVFRGSWQHQGNAGKYGGKSVKGFEWYYEKLRPMMWHVTDCEYYDGKIYATGAKEFDGSTWVGGNAARDYYYNHRAQIWENGKDYMQPSSPDYSSSWAASIDIVRDRNRTKHIFTSGYRWLPNSYFQTMETVARRHKVTHEATAWRDKNSISLYKKQVYKERFDLDYRVDKMVVINYGYGYYLYNDCMYVIFFNDNGSLKSKSSVIGGSNIKVLDICKPGVYRDGSVYALVEENGEDKVYKVSVDSRNAPTRKLIHNFGKTGMKHKLIAASEY